MCKYLYEVFLLCANRTVSLRLVMNVLRWIVLSHCIYRVSNCCLSGLVLESRGIFYKQRIENPALRFILLIFVLVLYVVSCQQDCSRSNYWFPPWVTPTPLSIVNSLEWIVRKQLNRLCCFVEWGCPRPWKNCWKGLSTKIRVLPLYITVSHSFLLFLLHKNLSPMWPIMCLMRC